MGHQESDFRKQKAVLWSVSSTPTDYGRYKLNAAVQLDVRWEERKHETTNPQGTTILADAMLSVGQAVTVGSIMWKGRKSELPDPVTGVTDLYEVVSYNEIPDLKGRGYERTVSLQKWSNELPELA